MTSCMTNFTLDSVEWNFLKATLKHFNFGTNLLSWIDCFYKNIKSCVTNKGFSNGWFPLNRGVRQGCPLSTALFVCVIEVLALYIRQNNDISGLELPSGKMLKCSLFADDATFFVSDENSAKSLLSSIDRFGNLSGLRINLEKTELLKIGSLKDDNKSVCQITPTDIPVKILGIFIGHDKAKCYDLNTKTRLSKLKDKLDIWSARDLTLRGKVLILKSLGISQITHLMSMICLKHETLKETQKLSYAFVWNRKPEKIKRSVIIAPKEKGGVDMVNVFDKDKASKICWIKRFFDDNNSPWKEIPKYYFDQMGGLEYMLQCNLDETSFPHGFPEFYKQAVLYWTNFENEKK